jgi:hypothetical protein
MSNRSIDAAVAEPIPVLASFSPRVCGHNLWHIHVGSTRSRLDSRRLTPKRTHIQHTHCRPSSFKPIVVAPVCDRFGLSKHIATGILQRLSAREF